MGNLPALRRTVNPMAPVLSRGSLFPLTDWFDRTWAELIGETRMSTGVDTYTTDDEYVAHVDLPGIEPTDEVNVSIANRTISVKAENADGSCGYNYSFSIPHWVEEASLSAKFENGALNISAPKPEHLRPRLIPVEVVKSAEEKTAT